ncbi:MAG: rRNA maturation RNase YbeY, partial [Candidatus Omnitrophica bacterium]|nr:rRNA maturation RNase YbeY [Candidatus Omnitrophota bacterium]
VIAFSAQEGKYIAGTDKFLGDIAISLDAAERQAQIFKSTPKEELKLYLVHGVLHLLGYDDLTKAGFKMIAKRQAELLKRAG